MSIPNLIVTEKYNQARAIASCLGFSEKHMNSGAGFFKNPKTGDIVTFCVGHLLRVAYPKEIDSKMAQWKVENLPFIPKEWKLLPEESKKKQLKVVVDLVNKAKSITIASDKEREGELIVVEILEFTGFKGERKRALYSEITPDSLRRAFKAENIVSADVTYPMYLEALARQRADYIIGLNATMGMTAQNKDMIESYLSYGRVVTSVNWLVQEKERSIKTHIPVNYYSINAVVGEKNLEVKWQPKEELKELLDPSTIDYNVDKAKKEVEGVIDNLKNKKAHIKDKIVQQKKTKQPGGFALGDLQREADKKFKFGVAQTLKIAQKLYEDGYITYPRTDSAFFEESEFKNAPQTLNAIKKAMSNEVYNELVDNSDSKIKTKIWDTKKVTDHGGIAPTNVSPKFSSLSDEEQKIYKLIADRFLAQFYPEYIYENTKYSVVIGEEDFITSGNVPVSMGWKVIYSGEDSGDKEDKKLPSYEKGTEHIVNEINLKESTTTPPERYTEGTLLADMENAHKFVKDKKLKALLKEKGGIGRPSTASAHVEKIKSLNYIVKKKNKLYGTEFGDIADQLAPKILKDPATTAYWEQLLEEIGKGKGDFDAFIKKQELFLEKIMEYIKSDEAKLKKAFSKFSCPSCGFPALARKGKYGKYFKCTNKKDCGVSLPNVGGRPGKPKEPRKKDICPSCGLDIIRYPDKKKEGNFYWQCSHFFDEKSPCKTRCFDKDGVPGEIVKAKVKETSDFKCENCNEGYLIKRFKGGDKSKPFWGCNAFPKCKNIVSDESGKPKGY